MGIIFTSLEVEVTEAPQWLLDIVITPKDEKYKRRLSNDWVNLFNNTSEGSRNNNVASLAGHLFRRFVDPMLVIEIIRLWNENKVNLPLDIVELNIIIDSIAAKEARRRQQRGETH